MKALIKNLKSMQPEPKKPKKLPEVTPEDNLNLEKSLVDAISGNLEASNGTFWKQSNSFAPSSTNQCPRYAVYRFRGYQQEISFLGQTRRLFDLGNRIEDAVGQMFTDLGILVDSQIEMNIHDPAPVRGYIDFIIDWDGEKVVECKSINEAGFAYRKAYHKPKDEHYRQIQFYLLSQNHDSGFLFYYCKNDSAILPLLVKRDDKFIETTMNKYAKIFKVFKDGNIPERPYKKESQNCSRCDAFTHCWSDQENGIPVNLRKKDS
jgi:hypothetical protein